MSPRRRKAKRSRAWTLEDFVSDVDRAMQAQAREHPRLRQAHARLSPEGKATASLVHKLLAEADAEEQTRLIEAIVAKGEVATRILIDALLKLREKMERRP